MTRVIEFSFSALPRLSTFIRLPGPSSVDLKSAIRETQSNTCIFHSGRLMCSQEAAYELIKRSYRKTDSAQVAALARVACAVECRGIRQLVWHGFQRADIRGQRAHDGTAHLSRVRTYRGGSADRAHG